MPLSESQIYVVVGKLIQTARLNAALTQDDVASRVGLSRTSISNIEHGRQKIQIHTLFALSHILGIPPQSLLPIEVGESQGVDFQSKLEDFNVTEREWIQRIVSPVHDRSSHEPEVSK